MMRNLIILYVILSCSLSFSQDKSFTIKGHHFEIKTTKKEETDNVAVKVSVNLYRKDASGHSKYLLSHIIKEKGGDHNSESLELGDYSVSGDEIIFYSFWCRTGDAPVSPYGARIQLYKVDNNGRLKLHKSRLYIETSRQGWHENKGIEYLFTKAKTSKEKAALKAHIEGVEKAYNAKFVMGKAAENLIREVKLRLREKIEDETKDWDKNNSFGTKL